MADSAWIDRLASDLLDLETELRPLLRTIRYHHDADVMGAPQGSTRRARYGNTVSLSANEARTLLRAAMPYPVSSTRLRQPHARMLAALQLFAGHLLSLSQPGHVEDHAAAAGVALLQELRGWLATARWHQACRRAGVRWPQPQGVQSPVTAITGQQAPAEPEHGQNTVAGMAESHRVEADPMGAQVRRTARHRAIAAAAAQDAIDLAAAEVAGPPAVVPLRRPAAAARPAAAPATQRRKSA